MLPSEIRIGQGADGNRANTRVEARAISKTVAPPLLGIYWPRFEFAAT